MPALTIRTIQVGKRNKVDDFLDVSVKSGDPVFAPTWDMVMRYKENTLSEAEYTTLYRRKMQQSWTGNPDRWKQVIWSESVTLGCYCRAGDFCHRTILAEYLRAVAESLGYTVTMAGEVT